MAGDSQHQGIHPFGLAALLVVDGRIGGIAGRSGRGRVDASALVEEMCASVEWLNAAGSRGELRSLQPTVTAVHEHLHRMLRLSTAET